MSAGRIVIVEDEAKYRDLLAEALAADGYEVESAADGAAGLVLIRRTIPDAVVLDWVLPILDGGALTRAIKGDPALARVFVIITSARGAGVNRAEGIEIGADDYLVKPIEPKELLAKLRNGLTMRRLRAELEEKNRELARLASTDTLTELPNRRSFDHTLERELRGAKRYSDAVSLVLLDLDEFKSVNDRFGHGVGDEVLKEIGVRLRDACRAGDQVARIGERSSRSRSPVRTNTARGRPRSGRGCSSPRLRSRRRRDRSRSRRRSASRAREARSATRRATCSRPRTRRCTSRKGRAQPRFRSLRPPPAAPAPRSRAQFLPVSTLMESGRVIDLRGGRNSS